MALRYRCDECGSVASVPESRLGKTNWCPRCDTRLPREPLRASGGNGAVYVIVFGLLAVIMVAVGGIAAAAWFLLREDANPPMVADNPPPPLVVGPNEHPGLRLQNDNPPPPAPPFPEPKPPVFPDFPPPMFPPPNFPKLDILPPEKPKPPSAPLKLPPAPARPPITPWPGTERSVYALPGPADRAVPAGDGRFIVFHFAGLRKLGLFDVNEGKITKYVDLAEDKPLVAAGMNKIVTYLPQARMIQRHNLLTGERELLAPLKLDGTPKRIEMGSASAGPVAVATDRGGSLLDLETLKELPLPETVQPNAPFGDPPSGRLPFNTDKLWAGANGRVFVGGSDFRGQNVVILDGGVTVRNNFPQLWGFGKPSADGKHVFIGGLGALTPEGKKDSSVVHSSQNNNAFAGYFFLPAAHGPYYLHLHFADGPNGYEPRFQKDPTAAVSIYAHGIDTPITRLLNIKDIGNHQESINALLGLPEAVQLIPRAKLLAVLNPGRDRLNLIPVDVDQAMDEAASDFLLVMSQAPGTFTPGRDFRYPVRVRSKAGKPVFKLETGPAGMKMLPDGTLTWKPDFGLNEKDVSVVVSVKDAAGKEALHTFTLLKSDVPEEYVPEPEPVKAVPEVIEEPKQLPARVAYRLPQPPPEPDIEPADPFAKPSPTDVPVPGQFDTMMPAGGGRYVVLHAKAAKKAHVFDINTRKIERVIDLGDADATVTAGMTRLFVYQPGTQTIERFSLADGKSLGRQPRLFGKTAELLIGSASEGPLFVRAGKWAALFDADTLAPMTLPVAGNEKGIFPFSTGGVWVSANGRTFGNMAAARNGATHIRAAVLSPAGVTTHTADGFARYVQPSADGKWLHFGGHATRLANLERLQLGQPELSTDPDAGPSVLPVAGEDVEAALLTASARLGKGVLMIRKVSSQVVVVPVTIPGLDLRSLDRAGLPTGVQVNITAGLCLAASPEKDRLQLIPLNLPPGSVPPRPEVAWTLPPVPAAVKLKPTTITAPVMLNTESTPRRLIFGGGGRFLIDMPSPREIRVYDLIANRVHQTIRTTSAKARFAAGQTKLAVCDGEDYQPGLIKRYDLETGKLEQTAATAAAVQHLSMGAASEGPLLLSYQNELNFMSLKTLSVMKTDGEKLGRTRANTPPIMSADGRVAFCPGSRKEENSTIVVMTETGPRFSPGKPMETITAQVALSGDGNTLFLGDAITDLTAQAPKPAKPPVETGTKPPMLIPALTGDHYLEVHSSRNRLPDGPDFTGIVVFKRGKPEPVGRLIKDFATVPHHTQLTDMTGRSYLMAAIPDAGLLLWHERSTSKIVLTPVDFDKLPMDALPEKPKLVSPKPEPPMPPKVDPTTLGPPVVATKPLTYPPVPSPLPVKAHELKEPFTFSFDQPTRIGGIRTTMLAGGGRFILRRRDSRLLEVFDLNELKVTHTLTLPENAGAWVAGRSKLYAYDTKQKAITRYDLLTGKEEKTGGSWKTTLGLHTIGSATDGPIIATQGLSLTIIDGDTLEPMILNDPKLTAPEFAGKRLHATPDGRGFAVAQMVGAGFGGPAQLSTMFISRGPDGFTRESGAFPTVFALPSADGATVFTGGYGPLDAKFAKLPGVPGSVQPGPLVPPVNVFLPAADGPFAVRYRWTKPLPPAPGVGGPVAAPDATPGFDIYGTDLSKPITSVKTVDPLEREFNPFMPLTRLPDMVFLIPRAKVLAVMSPLADKIHLYPVDLEAEMAKSGVETPWVTSTPPAAYVPGQPLKHPLKVVSKTGGLKFTVNGPPGMTVGDTGELTWTAPADARDDVRVSMTVKDAKGNQSSQVFWMTKK